ncbi:uncharacterized protein LOC134811744 [Bolinopsis microptera]|uniref:uncharacterized protein LOC134811744 n=1 Tax=Bolinopsis microptera TaxID=2820187 RepID=UPI003078F1F0
MEKKTKGWISKLFTFAVLAAIIVQIVKIVNPINRDAYRSDGVCNITSFYWVKATCMRDNTFYFLYDVPVVAGIFVKLDGRPDVLPGKKFNNVTSQKYEALFLNNSYHKNTAKDNSRATLYDDYSDNPPINCTSANIVSTKQLLLQYLPILQGILNVDSTTVHTLSYYPGSYFNCTSNHLNGFSAFIDYQRGIKLLIIPFVVTMLAFVGGLFLITKYDIDGPIKEFATFLLQILFMVVYLVNFVFFVIVRVIIGQFIFNVSPGEPIDFLTAGSIFFPLVWLYKKVREEWRKRQTVSSSEHSLPS